MNDEWDAHFLCVPVRNLRKAKEWLACQKERVREKERKKKLDIDIAAGLSMARVSLCIVVCFILCDVTI